MSKALVGLLVAAGVAFLIYRLAAPALLATERTSGSVAGSASPVLPASGNSSLPPSNSQRTKTDNQSPAYPIAPPRTEARQQAEETEKQRGPLYAWLQKDWAEWIDAARPSFSDPAVLELYARASRSDTAETFFNQIIVPHGRRYGFEKALIFTPNRPGDVQRFTLTAEAAIDRQGAWNLIYK